MILKRKPLQQLAILLAVCLVSVLNSTAQAQLLWSFEPDLEGWSAANATVSQSTFGATEGSMSLLMDDLTSGFKNDVGKTGNFNGGTAGFENAYDLLLVAADEIAAGKTPKFEFDFTFDFGGIDPNGDAFMQLGMYINSSAGFTQYGTGDFIGGNTNTSFPILTGGQAEADGMTITPTATPNQYRAVVPLGPTLALAQGSTFFDIGFKSNGGWQGTVDLAIDNIRLSGLPEFTEETIFSWETPDDLGTPGVNEQFENWTTGFGAGHTHAISSSGATDGSSSLEINRQGLQDPNGAFTWGSQFVLDSDIDPDPNVVNTDPTIQGLIESLVGKINAASSLAFDVTFDDSFPNSPTYTSFGVHITDDQETFFDGFSGSFNGIQTIGSTSTVTIPLGGMVDDTLGESLAEAGLNENSTFLRIGLATNTDGAGIYQIDNFRLLTQVPPDSADFDGDGLVTGLDFLIYQQNLGLTGQTDNSNGDANGDGVVGAADLAIWEGQVGGAAPQSVSLAAVPEPSSALLAWFGCGSLLHRTRKV